jgi:hypothetical protein
MEYKRNCPKCNCEISYISKKGYTRAIRDNTTCRKCHCWNQGKSKYTEENKISNCPQCQKQRIYKNIYDCIRSKNLPCGSCQMKNYYKIHRPHNYIDGNRQKTWHLRNPDKARAKSIKHKYHITSDQYDTIKLNQQNCCAICNKPESEMGTLHLDHCHNTNNIRGFLCHNCNKGLGHFSDNIEILHKAIKYLQKNTPAKMPGYF